MAQQPQGNPPYYGHLHQQPPPQPNQPFTANHPFVPANSIALFGGTGPVPWNAAVGYLPPPNGQPFPPNQQYVQPTHLNQFVAAHPGYGQFGYGANGQLFQTGCVINFFYGIQGHVPTFYSIHDATAQLVPPPPPPLLVVPPPPPPPLQQAVPLIDPRQPQPAVVVRATDPRKRPQDPRPAAVQAAVQVQTPTREIRDAQAAHASTQLLETLSLTIHSVSTSPLDGNDLIRHVRSKTSDIVTRYIPCVNFFVNCQQNLSKGVKAAFLENMSSNFFFLKYIAPLPERFERTYNGLMRQDHLTDAMSELNRLVNEARDAIPHGLECINCTFLGGMRENESFGLRKWLSTHGGAGNICNNLEAILRAVVFLERDEIAIKLAEMLRPIALEALGRLKKDVPAAYQKISPAHPHLPFFHRLTGCLKQTATWHPEEDDVIFAKENDSKKKRKISASRYAKHGNMICLDSDD